MSLFRWRPQIVPSATVLALLLALALAVVAGMTFCWPTQLLMAGRAPNSIEASVAIAVEAALEPDVAYDVLFLGDSTAESGLQPLRFQDLSGLSAYNLGCAGALGIDGDSVLLRLYLERHRRPRAIVFAITPEGLGVGDDEFGRTPIQERFFGCYGAPQQVKFDLRSVFALTRAGLMNHLAILRGESCSKYFDDPVAGVHRWSFNQLRDHIRSRRGNYSQETELPAGETRHGYSGDSFPVSDPCRDSLRALAAQTARARVPLIILLTPMPDCPTEEHFPGVIRLADQLEAEFDHVSFARPEVIEFPSDMFFETVHLNRRGAELFTEIAADVVSGVLGDGGRLARRDQPALAD